MGEQRVPVAIERVRTQFGEWRSHKSGRERIPERLWRAAVEVAQRYGVHAVSRAVRLEHSRLKRRVEEAASGLGDRVAFIELDNEPAAGSLGCIVELEKGNGTRMRICVREAAAVDWGKLKEAFLGA